MNMDCFGIKCEMTSNRTTPRDAWELASILSDAYEDAGDSDKADEIREKRNGQFRLSITIRPEGAMGLIVPMLETARSFFEDREFDYESPKENTFVGPWMTFCEAFELYESAQNITYPGRVLAHVEYNNPITPYPTMVPERGWFNR